MPLNSLMIPAPQTYVFTEDYRNFLETMLFYFRDSNNTPVIQITPEIKHVYKFDLEGYLLDKGIPISEHYLIMRINEIDNLHDLEQVKDYLILPDPDLLQNINSIYRSKLKK